MNTEIRVWVGNLGKYNEGVLMGDWLTLPVSREELDDFLYTRVGIATNPEQRREQETAEGRVYDEYSIFDVDITRLNGLDVDEYTDLNTLNACAAILSDLDAYDLEKVEAAMLDEGGCNVSEAANLAIQVDDIEYYAYAVDDAYMTREEKYAYTLAECDDDLSRVLDSRIGAYIDMEKLGRDMAMEGCVSLMEDGYIDNSHFPDTGRYTYAEICEEAGMENATVTA